MDAQPRTTWGYDEKAGKVVANGGTTPYAPIDTMIINVNGQKKTLNAYANVKADGSKDAENGAFQCTALVAEYLSDLGFKNAPNNLPNGINVANALGTGANKQYFDFSTQHAPAVGSIISMETNAATGHVAIVKGITPISEKEIKLTLIEENMTVHGENTFAVNRQITLIKGVDGTWQGQYQITPGGPFYGIVNWVTPIKLP